MSLDKEESRPVFTGRARESGKPSSVPMHGLPFIGGVHSSRQEVTSLLSPKRSDLPWCCGRAVLHHSWSCSDRGLPGRHCHQHRRCALTAPFHHHRGCPKAPPRPRRSHARRFAPVRFRTQWVAVYFLLHFPPSYLDWELPSGLPCGARTFLQWWYHHQRTPRFL